jgi:hypothetical protein
MAEITRDFGQRVVELIIVALQKATLIPDASICSLLFSAIISPASSGRRDVPTIAGSCVSARGSVCRSCAWLCACTVISIEINSMVTDA